MSSHRLQCALALPLPGILLRQARSQGGSALDPTMLTEVVLRCDAAGYPALRRGDGRGGCERVRVGQHFDRWRRPPNTDPYADIGSLTRVARIDLLGAGRSHERVFQDRARSPYLR